MLNNSIKTQEFNKKSINQPAPLSKAHIRPPECHYLPDMKYRGASVEYCEGASLIRTRKTNLKQEQVGGGASRVN